MVVEPISERIAMKFTKEEINEINDAIEDSLKDLLEDPLSDPETKKKNIEYARARIIIIESILRKLEQYKDV